ncbi:16S rRNA (cytosine(1402)-N(4))-methyltransferase RsmH, partial [candidate division KSB1 bacterium]|nr:16S rRNA (cytosine(1402)-N(4))-methyltransferase RsmH [candidate division KSB1 bacterium]
MQTAYHIPVLLPHVIRSLSAKNAALIIDATLGDGGYAEALLKAMPPHGRVVGIDRDPEALQRANARLGSFGDRFHSLHGNFRDIKKLLAPLDLPAADGIVVDLGVSTRQITNPQLGFMYSADGPLSMQMNPAEGRSAGDIVNTCSEEELAGIIYRYGEERASRRIAAAIVRARERKKITTTGELADIIRRVVSGPYVIKTLARVFQSIRMVANQELESLQALLPQALDLLRDGGRLVVLSYHSGEDRLVKHFLQQQADPCTCPPDLPRCVCGARPRLKILAKVVMADEEEVRQNPHARSVRMRSAIKC